MAAQLPPDATEQLRNYLEREEGPLAVRASSLFAAAFFMQPLSLL